MKTAVLYSRVSSEHQISNTSLDTQEAEMQAWCDRKGYKVVKIFREEGQSAKTRNRDKLIEAQIYCRKQKPTALVVWKYNRFARNQEDHHVLKAWFRSQGIQVLSATEPVSEGPAGTLLEGVIAAVSEFDNALRAEVAKAGMNAMIRMGYWVNRAPYGYRNTRTQEGMPTLEICQEEVEFIRMAYQLASDSMPQSKIAEHLLRLNMTSLRGGQVNKQLVFRVLRNPVYMGQRWTDGELSAGRWPAVVTEREWWMAQPKEARKGIRMDEREEFPLRGLVTCHFCGRPLTAAWSKGKNKKYPYYNCYKPDCRKINTRKEDLERAVEASLDNLSVDPKILEIVKAHCVDLWRKEEVLAGIEHKAARRKVEKIREKKRSLIDLKLGGKISQDDFEETLERIEIELGRARQDEASTEESQSSLEEALILACQILEHPRKWWYAAEFRQKRELLRLIYIVSPSWDGTRLRTPTIHRAVNDLRSIDSTSKSFGWPNDQKFEHLSHFLYLLQSFLSLCRQRL